MEEFDRILTIDLSMVRNRTPLSRNSKVKRYFMVIDLSHRFLVPCISLILSGGV